MLSGNSTNRTNILYMLSHFYGLRKVISICYVYNSLYTLQRKSNINHCRKNMPRLKLYCVHWLNYEVIILKLSFCLSFDMFCFIICIPRGNWLPAGYKIPVFSNKFIFSNYIWYFTERPVVDGKSVAFECPLTFWDFCFVGIWSNWFREQPYIFANNSTLPFNAWTEYQQLLFNIYPGWFFSTACL